MLLIWCLTSLGLISKFTKWARKRSLSREYPCETQASGWQLWLPTNWAIPSCRCYPCYYLMCSFKKKKKFFSLTRPYQNSYFYYAHFFYLHILLPNEPNTFLSIGYNWYNVILWKLSKILLVCAGHKAL